MLSRFHLIPERYGRTDGQTDLLYNQYRDKKRDVTDSEQQRTCRTSVDSATRCVLHLGQLYAY